MVSHKIVHEEEESRAEGEEELPKEDIEGCAHCLRSVIPKDQFPLSDAIYKAIYTDGVPEGVECEHCGDEHYCSDDCRKVPHGSPLALGCADVTVLACVRSLGRTTTGSSAWDKIRRPTIRC